MSLKSTITVLYERLSDGEGRFDVSYYVNIHMSIVMDKWKAFNIEDWQVVEYTSAFLDVAAPYVASAVVTFGSADGASKALSAAETKDVFGDVPNFTNLKPLLMLGKVAGHSQGAI
ncbi:unnamed protein product [Clonostachys chloroleuca]|uniref:Ethyl tert-butyl ether degradation EthD n=1 Tax=Clonostachys chloroleuca TaxID=1926264 RepID=A0AA35M8N8_9HYPO|nr:unnamed protein product [Clonostachys chloroleuca]